MAHFSSPDTPDPDETAAIERRQHPRHVCRCPAVCRTGSASCDAVVVDASNGGFGLGGLTLAVAAGDILTVELDQIGSFRCRVAWKRGTRAGVEFLDEESPRATEMQDLAHGLTKRQSTKTHSRPPHFAAAPRIGPNCRYQAVHTAELPLAWCRSVGHRSWHS